MRGAVLYGPRDVRFEERDAPKIVEPTDALIGISATCVCGSDLWPYRGIPPVTQPTPMGHEYCGLVAGVGSAVRSIKTGQFVIGSFFASDNTCPNCQAGYQSSCRHRELVAGAQAPLLRVPLADGTLVATPEVPADDLLPSLLAASDVLGTGWFAADAANVQPGKTVAVVGDGGDTGRRKGDILLFLSVGSLRERWQYPVGKAECPLFPSRPAPMCTDQGQRVTPRCK